MRSMACTPVFSSTQSTTAASGGFRYSPTTSRTYARDPTNPTTRYPGHTIDFTSGRLEDVGALVVVGV